MKSILLIVTILVSGLTFAQSNSKADLFKNAKEISVAENLELNHHPVVRMADGRLYSKVKAENEKNSKNSEKAEDNNANNNQITEKVISPKEEAMPKTAFDGSKEKDNTLKKKKK